MIDFNATFFVQFVNFLLILILLNVVLIGPIRRILKKRAEVVASRMGGIEQFVSTANSKLADYEKALDAARQQATTERVRLKSEGLDKEKTLLETATAQAGETVRVAREAIASQADQARKTLGAGVDGLATKAVTKVLAGAA